MDTFTSILAGTTIFAILGNLAHNLQVDDIREVVRSGTGLAFISYPDAIAKFDWLPQVNTWQLIQEIYLFNFGLF